MRIERLEREYDIGLRFVHFSLHPETPPEGRTLQELFRGRSSEHIRESQRQLAELAGREGLPYGSRKMTYNSQLAQELGAWADTQAGGRALHDALFRAYFVDGANLARVDALLSIVDSAGLPVEDAREVLESRSFRDVVETDWRRSRELGVRGVPTFAMDGRTLVGAQPYEALERLVRNAGARPRAEN